MTDDELRRLAKAALVNGNWYGAENFSKLPWVHSDDAAFIAAANPETVKRLLDRVAKAEADALAAHAAGRITGMEEAAAWHDDRAKKEREVGAISGARAEEFAADAIRAALDAAAHAECVARAGVNECEPQACRAPCKWCAAGATAAVAAFLRALPACDVLMDRSGDLGMHSTVTLAAAVEATAGEDGNG